MRILCVLILFAVSGCMSIPSSPTSRYYSLQPMDKARMDEKFTISNSPVIGLGPIKIPEYQNRPQIVTRDRDGMVKFAQFDRWSDSLDRELEYVISENLTAMLPGAAIKIYPWNSAIPVKYHVVIDVVGLESELDDGLFFVAQWSVVDTQNNKMLLMRRSELHEPIDPRNYPGLVRALNRVCVSLSKEMAQELAILTEQAQHTKNDSMAGEPQ